MMTIRSIPNPKKRPAKKSLDLEVVRDLAVAVIVIGTMTENARAVLREMAVQIVRVVQSVPAAQPAMASDLPHVDVAANARILARKIQMFRLGTKSSIRLSTAI
jgi:hypothetical protein